MIVVLAVVGAGLVGGGVSMHDAGRPWWAIALVGLGVVVLVAAIAVG